MLKMVKFSAIAGVAIAGLAAPAMALDTSTDLVNINITVAPVVSMWVDTANLSLTLDGANAENSAAVLSGINLINNVDAKLDVAVTGALPVPIVPGGGINFFIFDNVPVATALANIVANAYNPAGALVWTQPTLGTSQQLDNSVGVNTSILHRNITYAAAAPGELPLPDDFALVVTYTLTENP